MIKNIKNFILNNKNDLYYILLLTIFLLVISIPKLLVQYKIGIGNWDTYLYLENGRNLAKMGWGDVPSIAPVLPMILSKMFLLAGHPYQEAIFNIDVIFYIIGVITFYLILRIKYEKNVSLVGSIIYATFTLMYSWVAIGGNDIIGVTGTLLSIYLILIAHYYNYKIYYLALPIAAYAFLSRYTAGVMIFSIIFFWIINRVNLQEIKDIVIGGFLGVISISWFLYHFYIHLGTPFPFLEQFRGTVTNTVVLDSGYLPDSWYYIKHIPNYLSSTVPHINSFNTIVNPMGNIPSSLSFVYIMLFLLAFVIIMYTIAKNVNNNGKYTNKNIGLLLIAATLTAIFLFSLGNISYIISITLLLISMYIIWKVLAYDIEFIDYDLMMLSLLLVYLIFQSILFTKNDRYFITVLPFIAYFITYTLDYLFNKIDNINLFGKYKKSNILSLVIIVILLSNSLTFVNDIPSDNDFNDIEEACYWLSNNENINNTTILYSDNWPATSWYLNIYCQRGVPNVTDIYYHAYFSKEILSRNNTHHAASYYIDATNENKTDYPGLIKLNSFDTVQIYKNKYLTYGSDYIYTKEYNDNLQKEIEEFNRTMIKDDGH